METQGIDCFDDPDQFDEAVATVRTGARCARSWVFEQCVQVSAGGDCFGDFLKFFGVVCDGAVCGIGGNLGDYFGIQLQGISLADNEFTPVGEFDLRIGAVGGDDGFTFTNHIAGLEESGSTIGGTGKNFTIYVTNRANYLCLSHDQLP
ncbi:MAG: hypothetical protein PHV02_14920 [Rhodocyclaceae bacterium]|nr:hypothetical protein [Rhodocyclaceae bacterium]